MTRLWMHCLPWMKIPLCLLYISRLRSRAMCIALLTMRGVVLRMNLRAGSSQAAMSFSVMRALISKKEVLMQGLQLLLVSTFLYQSVSWLSIFLSLTSCSLLVLSAPNYPQHATSISPSLMAKCWLSWQLMISWLAASMPKSSYLFISEWQWMRQIGSTITTNRNTTPMMATWFSLRMRKEGRAMPTLKEPWPSGLPYLRHFSLASSSVRQEQALDIMMNFATAYGLFWFLSGWYTSANLRYAFFIFSIGAFCSTPKISQGSKPWI